jgi:ABC transporter substrate binding protein
VGSSALWLVLSEGGFLRGHSRPRKSIAFGYLAPAPIPHIWDALFVALRDLGYVEGQNLKKYRYGAAEVLEALAAGLVSLQPEVIVAVGTPPALAAKRATTLIPIVIATAEDPVRLGVVSSFARPGGNVTGVTLYGTELNAQRIQLFREAIPGINESPFWRQELIQPVFMGGGRACRASTWLGTRFAEDAGNERASFDIR